jgi:hypothetical protein
MKEIIINCSYLQDKIKILNNKMNTLEEEAEKSNDKFNVKYNEYLNTKSQLEYLENKYKNNCVLYNIFCNKLFEN